MSRPSLSKELFRRVFQKHPLPVWIWDTETKDFVAVNPAAVSHYGYSHKEFLSMNLRAIRPKEDIPKLNEALKYKEPFGIQTWRHIKKDGTLIFADISRSEIDFEGRPASLCLVHDVTDRKRYEEALHDANQRFEALIQSSPLAIVSLDLNSRVTLWNPAAERLFGWTASEALGGPLPFLPFDRTEEPEDFTQALAGKPIELTEIERITKDGSRIVISTCAVPLKDPKGVVSGYVGFAIDVTERRRLEEVLRQSTKMEAIGRLAGGVAHDFNNILTIIMGYCSITLEELPESNLLRQNIDGIRKAADRAGVLTRQLLAFSRRQVLQPKSLDLNEIVLDTSKMLHRLIGEDVELAPLLGKKLRHVKADPGQIEQILMNLAVNARDAMPNGGKIVIETANVELTMGYARHRVTIVPGAYVRLAVSDNGIGMDEETKSHIFEPFFTTKEPGKGTGLGLATVYGIVKQSGGYIWVYSELQKGSTFKVYLPAAPGERVEKKVSRIQRSVKGTETVLLVEDEHELRTLARDVLRRHGYNVIEASTGEAALAALAEYRGPVEIMVTDVVMPRLGGRELAQRVAILRPATKVIFMSGYTVDAVVQHGVLVPGTTYLEKPFTPETLARKVREVLDGTS